MNPTKFSQLSQLVHYAKSHFGLHLLAGAFTDGRPQPDIPFRAVWLSLVLGEIIHTPSLLQLEQETKLPQWQRWVGYSDPISHDTFGYVAERLDPKQLRRAVVWINCKLKRGKAFEQNKIKGLLMVNLDANEQFCPDPGSGLCGLFEPPDHLQRRPGRGGQKNAVLSQAGLCAVKRAAVERDFGF